MRCYAPGMEASGRCSCDAQDELGITSRMTCRAARAAEMTGVGLAGIQSMHVHRAE